MPYEHLEHAHFAYFGNRERTSLYIMLAILSFAASLIGVFVPIYLYEMGLPVWQILFFYFLRSSFFVVCAVLLVPLLRRMSDKMMMSIAIPFLILFFLGLSRMDGMGPLFWILPLFWALYMQLFWVGFHLDFTSALEDDGAGREVGMRNMFMMLASFAGPLAGGFLIVFIGFSMTFIAGSFLLFLALVPLFFFPKRKMPTDLSIGRIWSYLTDRRTHAYAVSAIGFANEKMGSWIIWPLFVFLAIGSVEEFGALYSLGYLLAALMTFLMGRVTDAGKGKRLMRIFVPLESFVWVLKSFAKSAGFAAGVHIFSEINFSALRVPWGSGYYRLAKRMSAPGTYIFATQILFNTSRIVYLPILMLGAFYLPQAVFFRAALIMTGGFTLFYLAFNKQSFRAVSDRP